MRKFLLLCLVTGMIQVDVDAQRRNQPATPPASVVKDTVPPARPSQPANAQRPGPKSYKDVVTDKAITKNGLFTVHFVNNRWLFEFDKNLLGKDLLLVSRITKAPGEARGAATIYAGDVINESVIRFEQGPDDKIFLRKISHAVLSKDTASEMYRNIENSNVQPIYGAFAIQAYTPNKNGVVIDLTDFISGDNDILHFGSRQKSSFRLGNIQADKSYIQDVKSFPINTEIKTVKTYTQTPQQPTGAAAAFGLRGGPTNITFELNASIIKLPDNPMQPRIFDPRVGYFATRHTSFDLDPHRVNDVTKVTRWRLEPKDADMEKFKRGELVEPKKPIIFYIDPTTPAKWVPYLIQGVNDWQIAFEKAGFKNAIYALPAPTKEQDSTWSLEDARHSVIVYKPSAIPNASGPHVNDPRTGEILESHINWYHNVMKLLRNWYMIQASPSDPGARTGKFSDELMGELIRFVSSHEVGHTLGLQHNMGSSAATPVEKLRDRAWVEKFGHTSSIMDYARFNYVAQPEDKMSQKGLFPRINDYDIWAIEWAYKPVLGKNEFQEQATLNEWVKKTYGDPRLRFINQDGIDPRATTEALGDNAMKASTYGVKNLKWILPQLATWLNEPAKDFASLNEVYDDLVAQYNRYIGHVIVNIGGVYTDLKTTDQSGDVYTIVPKATQKEALTYLDKEVFQTPTWIIPNDLLNKFTHPASENLSGIQINTLNNLLSMGRLSRMINYTTRDAGAYRADDLVGDTKKILFTELATRKNIDYHRRALQKAFVEQLITLSNPGANANPAAAASAANAKRSDVVSIAKGTLRSLKSELTTAAAGYGDKLSKYHLQDLADRITAALEAK
ncbi:zinc-dependent metalloprotease [Gynurincola endophyticus]|uniref:zinc-dependent metalloprotease n=1 Tax=Gynurincola endophyticus TaxID=2479004 RepID=UPI001F449616|nr:zinc-dependent metalloprotease [Gynurincola endophyticus]